MLVVHRGMGTDSGRHVYLNQRPLSWPYDFRFTDSEGNLLDYHVESYDTGKVVAWVKLGRIPASPGVSTIRLYYGKAEDSDASNSTIIVGSYTANEPIHRGWSPGIAVSDSMPVVRPTAMGVVYPTSAAPAQQHVTAPSWFSLNAILLVGLGALMTIGVVLVILLTIFVLIDLLKNTARRG